MPTVVIGVRHTPPGGTSSHLLVEGGEWPDDTGVYTIEEYDKIAAGNPRAHKKPTTADPSRFRIYIPRHPRKWGFVKGGYTSARETAIQGAVRELQEETGLSVQENRLTHIGSFGPVADNNQVYIVDITEPEKIQIETTLNARLASKEGEVLAYTFVENSAICEVPGLNRQSKDVCEMIKLVPPPRVREPNVRTAPKTGDGKKGLGGFARKFTTSGTTSGAAGTTSGAAGGTSGGRRKVSTLRSRWRSTRKQRK